MEQDCDVRVQRLATPRDCSVFERNARDRERDDLAQQARLRWVELSADAHVHAEDDDDPLRRELWAALSASEYLLGRNATGTRQVIRRRGLLRAAEQLVCSGEPPVGVAALDEAGLLAFAWEHVVLRHPDAFSEAAVTAAREQLEAHESRKAAADTDDAAADTDD